MSEALLHQAMFAVQMNYRRFNFLIRHDMTRVILKLRANVLIERKERILPTHTICIESSHIRKFLHFYKTKIEIATSFDPIFNRFVLLLDFFAQSAGNIKKTAPGGFQAVSEGPLRNIRFAK